MKTIRTTLLGTLVAFGLLGGATPIPAQEGAPSAPVPAPALEITARDSLQARYQSYLLKQVEIELLGGTRKTIPTTEFLASSPENLSTGFRIQTGFGVDYRHQAEATTTIPAAFAEAVRARLTGLADTPDQVRELRVRFHAAAVSALEVVVIVECAGTLADRYELLRDEVAAALVETCTARGWVIPFPQITVHQGS